MVSHHFRTTILKKKIKNPSPMKLSIPSVSYFESPSAIAEAICGAKDGVVRITNLPQQPDDTELKDAFDFLSDASGSSYADRINQAYTKNLVYKDSFAAGNGGPSVDQKRVLDLSPERLESIRENDPELHELLTTKALPKNLAFWRELQTTVGMKLLEAVSVATGSPDVVKDFCFNYRMVDYYERSETMAIAPSCGEHRDFGTFTVIYRSSPGLQVFSDQEWMDVDVEAHDESNSALILFGWCTQIRSNGRIPAALHRVTKDTQGRRRFSSVLFCAPKHATTPLEPVVPSGDTPQYISGILVGQLRGKMARKWRHREGTLSTEDKVLEEEEIRVTKLKTQDDVVRNTVSV